MLTSFSGHIVRRIHISNKPKKQNFTKIKKVHETGRRGSKFAFDRLPGTRFSRLSSWWRQIAVLNKSKFHKNRKSSRDRPPWLQIRFWPAPRNPFFEIKLVGDVKAVFDCENYSWTWWKKKLFNGVFRVVFLIFWGPISAVNFLKWVFLIQCRRCTWDCFLN